MPVVICSGWPQLCGIDTICPLNSKGHVLGVDV